MAKDVFIIPSEGLVQFSSSAGSGSGKIQADGDDIVISNALGDVLLGDGASDVFIGDGTNNVDIVFEQNGEIRDDGSGKNIIFGSKTTNVFISGSNTVALQSGGGNVGIGKTAAGTELEVVGSISASGTVSALQYGGNVSGSSTSTGSFGKLLGDGAAISNISATVGGNTFATDLKIGRDSQNLIDFATTDNKIIFRVNNVNEVELTENDLSPITSNGVALGTTSLMWSDLFLASGGVINFNNGDITLTHSATSQHLKLAGGNFNVDGHITASGDISSSAKITSKELLVQAIANNVTPFNIRNVDGQKQLDLSIDTNQHSELGIFKDGGEKIRFNSYWPAVIDNDFYETGGGIVLGSDTTQAANRYGIYISAGPDSGSAYFAEHATFNSHITASGNISASGGIISTTGFTGTLLTAAQGNITSLGTLTTLTVDDITINGSTISDGGDFTLDVGGDITFDANGADIILSDDGTDFGRFKRDSSDFIIKSEANNKDIVFRGQDGGATITALTLDMSDAGSAKFNNHITASGNISASGNILTSGNVVGTSNRNIKNFAGIQDSSDENYIQFGSNLKVDIGDSGGSANSTVLSVDDNNNKITMTGDAPQVVIGGTTPATNQELTVVGEISASGTITALQYGGNVSGSSTSTGSFGRVEAANIGDISLSGATLFGTGLKIGRDSTDLIDFASADNNIRFRVNNSDEMNLVSDSLKPHSNDGLALGASNRQWSDLFLAEGGVINFDNGDVTITQTGNNLAIAGTTGTSFVGHITASGDISASGNYIGNREFSKTSNTDATHQGDIVYFGGTTSMDNGKIYHYKSDGTWELADADAVANCDGLLAVALGAASDTNGMLLRGTVTLDHDPGAVGDVLFLSTTAGQATATAPSGNTDIVRVIGYCLDASNGQIWFNPSSTFVEVSA